MMPRSAEAEGAPDACRSAFVEAAEQSRTEQDYELAGCDGEQCEAGQGGAA